MKPNSKTPLGESLNRTNAESLSDEALLNLRGAISPSMGPHWNLHSNVFIKRIALSRILYWNKIYSQILDVPGVICEFGVQWGATLATLANLRGIYEPYNYSRTILGFDTFEGFGHISPEDGKSVTAGDYSTMPNYRHHLEKIMQAHEDASPLSHIKKFDLIEGDATRTVPEWIDKNPHAMISLAIFDMDLYQPTRDVLTAILPRLPRGAVLVFDELNCARFPGETTAMAEILGMDKLRLRRDPNQPYCAWGIWGE
jgi:hypothetical protein